MNSESLSQRVSPASFRSAAPRSIVPVTFLQGKKYPTAIKRVSHHRTILVASVQLERELSDTAKEPASLGCIWH